MSFISKAERQKCWDSRDRYWDCLDTSAEEHERCLKLRQAYETLCPAQWVKHFDRKRDYLKFKAYIEKEGYEPLEKISSLLPDISESTSPLQTVTRRHRVYKELVTTYSNPSTYKQSVYEFLLVQSIEKRAVRVQNFKTEWRRRNCTAIIMEEAEKRLRYLRFTEENGEIDALVQLKPCYEIFKQYDGVAHKTSQFCDSVRVLIDIIPKLPSQLASGSKIIIHDVMKSLLYRIASCSLPLDGQMLSSAALCLAFKLLFTAQEIEKLCLSYLNADGYIIPIEVLSCPKIRVKNLEVFKVCFCHGILQSDEALGVLMIGTENESILVFVMLNILEEACSKYSRLTSLAFKVLVSWVRKVCLELKLNVTGFVMQRIFAVINSNWECPISGVKEQNVRLFELFLDVCSANRINFLDGRVTTFECTSSLLHYTMEGQPWKMKSKYYILSVLVPRYGVRKAFADFPDLAPGLVSTLSYSHLTSTGSGVYKTCLKEMNEDDWTTVFMPLIVEVLTGRNDVSIQKQNAFNYWIPSTLKKFPQLYNFLLDQLVDNAEYSGLENVVFSIVSLLKLGQESGLLSNKWDENFYLSSFKYLDFLNIMNCAMCHSSEAVRSKAFAVVCMSSKSYIIPSLKEFEMVQMFLVENVNSDCASLRDSILKSFALFLTRICDSSVHALEVKWNTQNSKQNKEVDESGILQNIHFLNWIHTFLISNLEPGTNYQRRILSLRLYLLILSYFIESPELTKKSPGQRKKGMALESKKVVEYALTLGQWPFISENSHKTILSCVLDSTDDVRETAGIILMEYFSYGNSNTEAYKPLLDCALQLCTSPLFYETESGALLMKVVGNWTYKMPVERRKELLCSVTRTKCNKILTRNRHHGSILMLHNQEKLLAGLENKPSRTVCSKVDSREYTKVEVKKKVRPYEGMLVMHPSLLQDVSHTKVTDETKIFEGMAVVTKDGTVGQRTGFPVAGKSYSLYNKQTHLAADTSSPGVNRANVNSMCCNMNRYEMLSGLRNSHASHCASEETIPGATEHIQNTFQRQDRQTEQEQEADCHCDIQTSWRPSQAKRKWKSSKKRKRLANLRKGKQDEVTLSSRLHKHNPLLYIETTKDKHCLSPLFSSPINCQESTVSYSGSVYNPVSSSSSGYESRKVQQPLHSKSSAINETEFSPSHTRSEDRRCVNRINSNLKSEEDSEWWVGPKHKVITNDWVLSESSEIKSVHNSESDIGTVGHQHPPKNTRQLEPKVVIQTYSGSAPLSVVLLTQAEAQLICLKQDLFQAASSGSPLHGTLTALIRLATQSDSPENGLMSGVEVNRTVMLLEEAVSFFLHLLAAKSLSTAVVSPSFAEMDDAIQNSIQQSLSDLMSVDEEDLQLSPAHLVVLNCVWLNLKACCTLASGLVCSAKCGIGIIQRCGRLIKQVLTRCRHKGAIESAGVALSVFVKTVTLGSISSDEDIQLMLQQMLTEILDSLVYGGNDVPVTRHSAGLSVLLHKLLASDMQTGKPLLHMCMSQLLEIASSSLAFGVTSETKSVLVDLPRAQALHFLKILIQDSSLRLDIAQYMNKVMITCFKNFSAPVWTVRNAALQLSGAVIPKLVGQKKIPDEEMTLGSGVSVEELFSHFPELTEFMLVFLQKAANCHPSRTLQQHADLIPMLSLLAKVAIGNEILMRASLVETVAQYRVSFLQLISSPIYHVRKLAAKAYERFTPFSSTYQSIVSLVDKLKMHNTGCGYGHFNCFRENDLNGILLTLKYLLKKLKHDSENMPILKCKMSEIMIILKEGVSSCVIWDYYTYFNRVLLLEIMEDNLNAAETTYMSADETFKKIQNAHNILKKEKIKNSFKPGLFLWVGKVIDVVLKQCCPGNLVSAWYNSYSLCRQHSNVMKLAFVSLKWRLLHDEQIDVAVKTSLFCALLKVCLDITRNSHASLPLLDVMLVLIQETKLNVFVTFCELQKLSVWSLSHRRSKSECSKVALPVVAGLLSQYFACRQCIDLKSEVLEFVLKLANCIKARTDVLKYEEDFRLSAAVAMHLMAPSLRAMLIASLKESSTAVREEITEIILDAELCLLQDEDHDVRIEAAKFVSVYTAEINQMFTSASMNPYSSLTQLVQPHTLLNLLTVSQAMRFLWNRLCFFPYELNDIQVKYCDNSHENGCIANPFDHGTNNIYSEETKVIDLLGTSLLDIIKAASEERRSGLIKSVINRMVNFEDDAETVLSVLGSARSCHSSSVSSRNGTCYIIAKKLLYQSKVIVALGIEGSCDVKCVMVELQHFLKHRAN